MDDNKIFLSSNIKHLRNIKGSTQQELASVCGKLNTTISNWEKGIREPDGMDLARLANYFNISIDDLMLKDLRFDNGELVDSLNIDIVKIPILGTIKAGTPIESQTDIIDYTEIPKSWIKGDKKFYGLKITGDSMFPKYDENDIVIFEQNDDISLCNGKDCAIMINGTESTFKKLLVNDQGIVLQPYNASYDVMMFSKEQVNSLPIKIVGIAREKRTKL